MTRRLFAMIAAMMLPLALGGCWFSPTPLLHAGNASTVPFEGAYRDPDGTENAIVIARTGNGAAYTLRQEEVTFDIFFLAVEDEWYAVQMSGPRADEDAGKPPSETEFNPIPEDLALYNLLHLADGELRAYEAVCDESFEGIDGIEVNDLGCAVSNVEGLRGAVRHYAELVEKGDKSAENFEFEVLERLPE